ncbi:MAG: glutathione S-transferase [Rhodospirillales bacterium 20-64-7]|nr:MAG: glutathione S-transferase [Rhodospirillales bacterium 20-64-7]
MRRLLYDLAGADDMLRFSPYCWRTKLALAHKNLPFSTVAWRFTEKDAIGFSGQGKVPVLIDGEEVVSDSQAIAEYLERAYPNEASLFGEPPSRALTHFIKAWTEDVLQPAIARVILPDVFAQLHAKDQPYFRETRERMFGMKVEDFAPRRAEFEAALNVTLKPLRTTLKVQSFLAGQAPAYADHIVFGAMQWGRMMSSKPLLAEDDPIIDWMDMVLGTYGL